MEVMNKNVAMLSNYEVYSFLMKSEKESKKKKTQKSQNLATVSYETKEYLASTPCANQSEAIIKDVLSALAKYPLTKAESLQLLNLQPQSPVEVQVIVEEMEERLSEEDIEHILSVIKLPENPPSNDQASIIEI